jgi:hypothetical protein
MMPERGLELYLTEMETANRSMQENRALEEKCLYYLCKLINLNYY